MPTMQPISSILPNTRSSRPRICRSLAPRVLRMPISRMRWRARKAGAVGRAVGQGQFGPDDGFAHGGFRCQVQGIYGGTVEQYRRGIGRAVVVEVAAGDELHAEGFGKIEITVQLEPLVLL
ncbi:MAG: hypothetical protein L6Q97_01275, partial [Thermoanaerobaculia bacterium]|nr:hypothetical protein [Thermoanaerobaculia bacterium]